MPPGAPWGGAFPPAKVHAPPGMRPMLVHVPVGPMPMPPHLQPPQVPVHHPNAPYSPTDSVAQPMPTINVGGVSYPAPALASPGFFKSPNKQSNPNSARMPSMSKEKPVRARSASRGRAETISIPAPAQEESASVLQLTSSSEDRDMRPPSASEMSSPFPPAVVIPPQLEVREIKKGTPDNDEKVGNIAKKSPLPKPFATWRNDPNRQAKRSNVFSPNTTSESSMSMGKGHEGGPSVSMSTSPEDAPVKPTSIRMNELTTPHSSVEQNGVKDPMLGAKGRSKEPSGPAFSYTDFLNNPNHLTRPSSVGPRPRTRERVTQHLGTPSRPFNKSSSTSGLIHPSKAVLSPPIDHRRRILPESSSSDEHMTTNGNNTIMAFPETTSTLRKMKEEALKSQSPSEEPLPRVVTNDQGDIVVQSLDFPSKIEKIILGDIGKNSGEASDRSLTSFLTAEQSSSESARRERPQLRNRYADVIRAPGSTPSRTPQQNPASSSNVPTMDPSAASTVAGTEIVDSGRMNRENRQLRDRLQEKELMISALEAQIEVTPSVYDAAKTPISSHNEDFNMDSISHVGLGRKPSRARSDIQPTLRQLQRVQDERDTLKNTLSKLESECTLLKQQQVDVEELKRQHQRKVEEITCKLELVEDDYSNLQSTVDQQKESLSNIDKMKWDVSKLSQTVEEKDCALQELSGKYSKTKAKKRELEQEAYTLRQELERSRNSFEEIQRQCEEENASLKNLEQHCQSLEQQMQEAEAQVREARAAEQAAKDSIAYYSFKTFSNLIQSLKI